jgi:hypothetical protein
MFARPFASEIEGSPDLRARLVQGLGDRLGPAVTMATTEHFNLQTARAATKFVPGLTGPSGVPGVLWGESGPSPWPALIGPALSRRLGRPPNARPLRPALARVPTRQRRSIRPHSSPTRHRLIGDRCLRRLVQFRGAYPAGLATAGPVRAELSRNLGEPLRKAGGLDQPREAVGGRVDVQAQPALSGMVTASVRRGTRSRSSVVGLLGYEDHADGS